MSKVIVSMVMAMLCVVAVSAQTIVWPAEFRLGTPIQGFQDDFSKGLDTSIWKWTGGLVGSNVTDECTASVTDGVLRLTSPREDPIHLLYDPGFDYSKDSTYQEVLLLVRMTNASSDARIGASVYTGPENLYGEHYASMGINLLMRNGGSNMTINLLNDKRAWFGTNTPAPNSAAGDWYWLRVRQEGGNVYGNFWLADTTEPHTWDDPTTWEYVWKNTSRSDGLAGILCSYGGTCDVGYILIKSDNPNMPLIMVPEPATMTLLALGGLALLRRKRA